MDYVILLEEEENLPKFANHLSMELEFEILEPFKSLMELVKFQK